MPIIAYKKHRFNTKTMEIMDHANAIITEYRSQGLVMSLRQVYYQFVSRALAPNQKSFYKNLSRLLVDARMAGLMDWTAIEDLTRFLRERHHFDDPYDAVCYIEEIYGEDLWVEQDKRFEVWLEKDSLMGTVAQVCEDLDVGYFACRGYSSATELWKAASRLMQYPQSDVTVIHMGDFDPTGLDATRNIKDRLDMFTNGRVKVKRIALTKTQINRYKPPPFPAKVKDSRYKAYVAEHGETCWELDSLPPDKLAKLVRDTIEPHIVKSRMKKAKKVQEENRGRLTDLRMCEDVWSDLPEVHDMKRSLNGAKGRVRALKLALDATSRQGEVSAKRITRLQRENAKLERNVEAAERQTAIVKRKLSAARKKKKSKRKKKKR